MEKLIKRYLVLIFMVLTACSSCRNENNREENRTTVTPQKMEEVNRILNQKDAERIEAYGLRKGLDLKSNESGLWFDIKSKGEGRTIKDGDFVILEYDCISLDGTELYSSKVSGPKEIIMGQSEIENGLDIGLRMLADGGEATFVLPPFLAFGLAGDDNKIPPRTVIVYDVKVKFGK